MEKVIDDILNRCLLNIDITHLKSTEHLLTHFLDIFAPNFEPCPTMLETDEFTQGKQIFLLNLLAIKTELDCLHLPVLFKHVLHQTIINETSLLDDQKSFA